MHDDDNNSANVMNVAEDPSSRLDGETAVITWSELVRHFARGVVIHVTLELDLVEAAECMTRDDVDTLEGWLRSGFLRRASDDDARAWTVREPEFWCVVTAPWVLVQEKHSPSDAPAVRLPAQH